MQADGIPDNLRRDEDGFDVLHDHEYGGDDERMGPVSPLTSRDEHGRHPAKNDTDVRNHGQNHDEQADERREIQAGEVKRDADQGAVDETDKKLAAEICDDVIVD